MSMLQAATNSNTPDRQKKLDNQKFTWTSISCLPTALIRMEKRDKSTPLGKRVASAKRMATDMQPSNTAENFSSCFLRIQRHRNSVGGTSWESNFYVKGSRVVKSTISRLSITYWTTP